MKEIRLISCAINFSISTFCSCHMLIGSRTNEARFPQVLCPVFPEPIGSCAHVLITLVAAILSYNSVFSDRL